MDNLTSNIPNFINIAHISIQRIRDWNKSIFIEDFYIPTSNSFDLSNATYKVKTLRGFYLIDNLGNVNRELTRSTYKLLNDYIFSDDLPTIYAKEGNNCFISPVPVVGSYLDWKFRLVYTGLLPAYSLDTDTDWFLDNWDALLYKSLLVAEPFLRNDGRVKLWSELFNSALIEMIKMDIRSENFNENFMLKSLRR